jgi:hypothetical protein
MLPVTLPARLSRSSFPQDGTPKTAAPIKDDSDTFNLKPLDLKWLGAL